MAPKQTLPVWKIGQFACVRSAWDTKDQPKWYFAEVARIIPAKTYAETAVDVHLYSVPDAYPVTEEIELLKDSFPSYEISRETVMLARLAAGIMPKKEHRYSQMVRVRLLDLCEAEPGRFLARLTEGKEYIFKRQQHAW